MASTPHKLQEKINARIFDEDIEPVLRETVVSAGQTTPRLLMLGGQPGSGKTSRLRSPAERELAVSGGFMAIDADQLRTFHPDWDSLNRADDMTAAAETHPDAAEWVDKAIALAIRERCHVIFDGTMGNSASAIDRIERFENAGYEIEVRVLAVNRCHSWLGVLRRHEQAKADIGFGRMTPEEVHDQAYEGLGDTLTEISSKKSGVRIRLYSRTASLVFDSLPPSRYGQKTATDALNEVRRRPWTVEEQNEFKDEQAAAVALASKRGADNATVEVYRALRPGP